MSRTDELLKDISDKLDKMIKIIALETIKDYETEQEKIEMLNSIGFRPVEIAKYLNKTPKNVGVQLVKVRKKKEKMLKNDIKINSEKNPDKMVKIKEEEIKTEINK
jgi:hypothetical protein